MLTLKAEQAAIKTISPLEWSWRDCLLLSEIPPGACSHFLSFTSLSSFPGYLLPLHTRSHSSALCRSVLVNICSVWWYIPQLSYFSLILSSLKNLIPLSVSTFLLLFIPLISLFLFLPVSCPLWPPSTKRKHYIYGPVDSLSAQWSLSTY